MQERCRNLIPVSKGNRGNKKDDVGMFGKKSRYACMSWFLHVCVYVYNVGV
jgi:hypothetical protein